MKKAILKFFGVAALAAGMMYNVQVFDAENGSDISLAALGVMAVANSESGDAKCTAELECGKGGKVTCTGKSECRVFGSMIECDQVRAYC